VAEFACPAGSDPTATLGQHFTPLFFYESVLSLIGVGVMLLLWRRFTAHRRLLIAGDVGLLYFVWYGLERSLLETLRSGWNWTFFGLATAQVVGLSAAAAAIVAIFIRHWWVRGHPEEAAGNPAETGSAPAPQPDPAPAT
jgi:prolipoprotein diacylglyceryltransferase